jgi:hypothetical protein
VELPAYGVRRVQQRRRNGKTHVHFRPRRTERRPRSQAGPAEYETLGGEYETLALVPQDLALDYAPNWGTQTWRLVKVGQTLQTSTREANGPALPPAHGEDEHARPEARRSLVRKLSRTLYSGAGSLGKRARFTACQVVIVKDFKDKIVSRPIRYDPETCTHIFSASIELGRNGKHRIAVRLQGELKKGWTPWSESLEIEAGKEPKGAVRQRQRLDKKKNARTEAAETRSGYHLFEAPATCQVNPFPRCSTTQGNSKCHGYGLGEHRICVGWPLRRIIRLIPA